MKVVLIVLGTFFLVLGIIGAFLPLLPTTPFLLLTAACYFRSSPKLYNRLISNRHLGAYIINYRDKKIIPLRAKFFSLSLMWAAMVYCIVFVAQWWWLRGLLLLVAIGVTIHILSFKSK